jgi:hypothetical protein
MYSYGFGFGDVDAYDAYGNMGGQSFLEYVPIRDTIAPTAEINLVNGIQNLILRDDRPDDLGLKSFKILDSMGIEIKTSPINEGMLQLSSVLTPVDANNPGQLFFEVSDVSNNTSRFTVCYTINRVTGLLEFMISSGHNTSCIPEPGFVVGAFGKYSAVFHTSDFSKSGNVNVPGNFTSATGSGGYGGLYISKRLLYNLNLTARLSLEQYGGTIAAPDSIISNRRDPVSGNLMPFQETHYLDLNSTYLALSLGGEYVFTQYLYGIAGLNIAFLANNSVEFKKGITIPDDFVYSDGSKELIISEVNSLSSLSSLRFGIFGGFGATVPVTNKLSTFLETNYNIYPFDIISDGEWTINNLSFIFGLKYQL